MVIILLTLQLLCKRFLFPLRSTFKECGREMINEHLPSVIPSVAEVCHRKYRPIKVIFYLLSSLLSSEWLSKKSFYETIKKAIDFMFPLCEGDTGREKESRSGCIRWTEILHNFRSSINIMFGSLISQLLWLYLNWIAVLQSLSYSGNMKMLAAHPIHGSFNWNRIYYN